MWADLLGFAAAALVLATFSMREARALRLLALGSNLLFIAYGLAAALPPIVVLHVLLLPINLLRLIELQRARAERTRNDDPDPGEGMDDAGGVMSHKP